MPNNSELPNPTVILNTVNETQERIDFGELKELSMEMYENAQVSEQFGMAPEDRHENFQKFKLLYNFLLKLEMQFQPELTSVNLF